MEKFEKIVKINDEIKLTIDEYYEKTENYKEVYTSI